MSSAMTETRKIPKSAALEIVEPSSLPIVMALLLLILLFAGTGAALFIPWTQTVYGEGKVIAYSPNARPQDIEAPIDGRIATWFVVEGEEVKAGQVIAELNDVDALLADRLQAEREAIVQKLAAVKSAYEMAVRNVARQKTLFSKGLSAQRTVELAEIEAAKYLSDISSTSAELTRMDGRIARQSSQSVVAPTSGTLTRIPHPEGGTMVKAGDMLARLIPETDDRAAELYVSARDLPLVTPGREVRLQFEGWPAIQLSGWPSVASGSFIGEVKIVDPTHGENDQFRLLVVPREGEVWPAPQQLRQGVRALGWVLLDDVSLGWELWRRFNGFPVSVVQMDKKPDGVKAGVKKK